MLLEKEINTIDIFRDNKLAASIITEEPVELISSGELDGFEFKIGNSIINIVADKVELK